MSIWQDKNLFIIAEIGGNHEGDFSYAKKLTHLACASKAHSVKFQVYTGDSLVSQVESPDRNKHFKKFELSRGQFEELAAICREAGKDFSVSVWNPESVDWVDDLVTFYKIGSGDLTCLPIIKKFTQKRKPIILSTGLATENEVEKVVDFIRNADPFYRSAANLAILQCNSMYPTPDEDLNLSTMTRFKELFDVTVGYSDHSIGSLASKVAIGLGAKIIETHFTDSREGKTFRDHKVSLTKDEIDDLYDEGLRIQKMLGSPKKQPTKSEVETGHTVSFRRAVYFQRAMKKGEVVKEEDLVFLRPCHGISAMETAAVVGKRLKKDHEPLSRIDWQDLD